MHDTLIISGNYSNSKGKYIEDDTYSDSKFEKKLLKWKYCLPKTRRHGINNKGLIERPYHSMGNMGILYYNSKDDRPLKERSEVAKFFKSKGIDSSDPDKNIYSEIIKRKKEWNFYFKQICDNHHHFTLNGRQIENKEDVKEYMKYTTKEQWQEKLNEINKTRNLRSLRSFDPESPESVLYSPDRTSPEIRRVIDHTTPDQMYKKGSLKELRKKHGLREIHKAPENLISSESNKPTEENIFDKRIVNTDNKTVGTQERILLIGRNAKQVQGEKELKDREQTTDTIEKDKKPERKVRDGLMRSTAEMLSGFGKSRHNIYMEKSRLSVNTQVSGTSKFLNGLKSLFKVK